MYKVYEKAKSDKSEEWRDEFLDNLAEEIAKKNKSDLEVERKKLNTIKHQRKIVRSVKIVRRKLNKNSTNKCI